MNWALAPRDKLCDRCRERFRAPGSAMCLVCLRVTGEATPTPETDPSQLGLFGGAAPARAAEPPAPAGDSTSKRAAAKVAPKTDTQRANVQLSVRRADVHGRTRLELQAETGLDGSSVRPRVLELLEAGNLMELDQERRGSRVLVAIDVAPWCEAGQHGHRDNGNLAACYRCARAQREADARHRAALKAQGD